MSDQRFGLGALGREGVSDVDEGLLLVLLLESWIVKEKRSEKREKLRLFPSRIHFFCRIFTKWVWYLHLSPENLPGDNGTFDNNKEHATFHCFGKIWRRENSNRILRQRILNAGNKYK